MSCPIRRWKIRYSIYEVGHVHATCEVDAKKLGLTVARRARRGQYCSPRAITAVEAPWATCSEPAGEEIDRPGDPQPPAIT
jgi:hypothetical protein